MRFDQLENGIQVSALYFLDQVGFYLESSERLPSSAHLQRTICQSQSDVTFAIVFLIRSQLLDGHFPIKDDGLKAKASQKSPSVHVPFRLFKKGVLALLPTRSERYLLILSSQTCNIKREFWSFFSLLILFLSIGLF